MRPHWLSCIERCPYFRGILVHSSVVGPADSVLIRQVPLFRVSFIERFHCIGAPTNSRWSVRGDLELLLPAQGSSDNTPHHTTAVCESAHAAPHTHIPDRQAYTQTHRHAHTQTHTHAHTHTVYMSPCGGLVVYLQHRVQSHSIVRWLIMGNRWKWGCLYCGRCTPCVALLKICSKYTAVYHLRYQQY